jgi:hypothetical protein
MHELRNINKIIIIYSYYIRILSYRGADTGVRHNTQLITDKPYDNRIARVRY